MPGTAIDILQNLIQTLRFFAGMAFVIAFLQNIVSPVGKGNGTITGSGFGRTGTPETILMPIFQSLVNGKRTFLPVDGIPGQTDQF